MKRTNQLMFALVVALFVILYSCNSADKIADRIYSKKEYLLKEFKDVSIIVSGGKFCQLSYYKVQFVNRFSFQKKNGSFVFVNDSIQYPIHEIVAFASLNIRDSLSLRKCLKSELDRLLGIMDEMKIRHVSAEKRMLGIDMILYFDDYKSLLYIKDTAQITNERWKSYLASGKKLDSNWFYVNEE